MDKIDTRSQKKSPMRTVDAVIAVIGLLFAISGIYMKLYQLTFFFCIVWIILLLFRRNYAAYENISKPYRLLGITARVIGYLLVALTVVFPFVRSAEIKLLYPLQLKYYKSTYSQSDALDFFPDKIPENVGDYKLEHVPTVMQGAGHTSLMFTSDSETIQECIREAKQDAILIFTLSEQDQYEDKFKKSSGSEYAFLYFYTDEAMKQNSENVTVYLLYSNFDFNHPHTSAVLVDEENCTVQFSRVG